MKISHWLLVAVIAILAYFLFFQGCGKKYVPEKPVINIKSKTVQEKQPVQEVESIPTKYTPDTFIQEKRVPYIPDNFLPKSTYDSLVDQYATLLSLYFSSSISEGETWMDSSKIKYSAKTERNKLQKINFTFFPSYPHTFTETTIKQEVKYREFYFDLGLHGVGSKFGGGVNVGFTYKDRQNRAYTILGGINTFEQYSLTAIRHFKL